MRTMRLFELVSEDGTSACPYVWRTRYALAQKELPYEIETIGLTDIPKILGGRYKSVPVLVDGDKELGDSWLIADYLDQAYPRTPPLFSGKSERAMVRFFDYWFSGQVVSKLLNVYALDIHNRARPSDRAYFRQSREARLGRTLEDYTADRENLLPILRKTLEPLRSAVEVRAFLGGETPNYADFIAIGTIIWVTGVGSIPLLSKDDTLLAWVDRCLGLYNGIGRRLKLSALA